MAAPVNLGVVILYYLGISKNGAAAISKLVTKSVYC